MITSALYSPIQFDLLSTRHLHTRHPAIRHLETGLIGFKELNKLLRRDVKAEEDAKNKRRREVEGQREDVAVADIFILRKQMESEVMSLDPWMHLSKSETSAYHNRRVNEAALR